MATEKLTEYERQRLENIKRNDQMMAALKLHSKASQLAASSKRQKIENQTKTSAFKSYKKPKDEAPVVIRRSLRARGMPPDSKGLMDDFDDAAHTAPESKSKFSPRNMGSFSLGDAYDGAGSRDAFVRAMRRFSKKAEMGVSVKEESGVKGCEDEILRNSVAGLSAHSVGCGDIKNEDSLEFAGSLTPQVGDSLGCRLEREGTKTEESSEFISTVKMEDSLGYGIKREGLDDSSEFISSLTLEEENVARVVPGRVMVVKFFPSTELRMVAVGSKYGNVGFWNMDPEKDEGDGVYLYRPHSAPIGGISIQPFNIGKIFTCCYAGFVRMMDVEKERFDLVHASDDAIFSLSQRPHDGSCLYFGEGRGGLNIWDLRVGKSTALWALHEDRINTIDFKPQDCFVFATSSTDGTACIWDLRRMGAENVKSLKVIQHERAVHSAYFSPSGSSLATTSFDDTVCIASGDNFEKTSHVFHNNQTGRWISSFRNTLLVHMSIR
ncbi:WD repeat-containing protein 76 isoform X2 [Rhodamnia argentea]|uniref:WD repeat-containing protein 76 isoform X2 n=1 Tax=Rhodamnia argentea TaxID=178133 RepID=A0A8B8QJE8_9MYRT|nr:WD repeat-containing protein 76 isoform X2 [Rhodamnia argentea]